MGEHPPLDDRLKAWLSCQNLVWPEPVLRRWEAGEVGFQFDGATPNTPGAPSEIGIDVGWSITHDRWRHPSPHRRAHCHYYTPRAALPNLVYWPRHTNLATPVGPERCLAMMSSALALSGESRLYTSSR